MYQRITPLTAAILLAMALFPGALAAQEITDSTAGAEIIAAARGRFAVSSGQLATRGFRCTMHSAIADSLFPELWRLADSAAPAPAPPGFTLKLREGRFNSIVEHYTLPPGIRKKMRATEELVKEHADLVFNCILTLDTVAFPKIYDQYQLIRKDDGYLLRFPINRGIVDITETQLSADLRVVRIDVAIRDSSRGSIVPSYIDVDGKLAVDGVKVDIDAKGNHGTLDVRATLKEALGLMLPSAVEVRAERILMLRLKSLADATLHDRFTLDNYMFKERE